MNRCRIDPCFVRFFSAGLILWMTCLMPHQAAWAQDGTRSFPRAARIGTLLVTTPPSVLLDGQPERLSPGARIRGLSNSLVLSASLAGQPVQVRYLRDVQGLIHEVWLLSEAEARDQSALSATGNVSFESQGAAPRTDDGKTPFNELPSYPNQ